MRALLLSLALIASLPLAHADNFYMEGAQYQAIEPPAPTNAAPGKVEVVELFWYGCPHCFHFEPTLSKWLASKPANVDFKRVPAVLNPGWVTHARAYYVAEQLGVLDKIHEPLFEAIHLKNQRLNTEDELAAFFAAHGVPEDEFRAAFNSFEVHMQLRQAAQLGKAYQATGVPAIVVNGKCLVSSSMAGGYPEMIAVVEHLVAQEASAAKP